jgi:hypothetical protein
MLVSQTDNEEKTFKRIKKFEKCLDGESDVR